MTPMLTCYGSLNGRQTVPRAELQAFLCFLQRTTGPATYICDATVVSKGFRRLRAGSDTFSRANQDLWTAIREASAQRDSEVHWVASHEENTMDCVDATTAWLIGLNTLARVAQVAAEMCDFPDTVPPSPRGLRARAGLSAIARHSQL